MSETAGAKAWKPAVVLLVAALGVGAIFARGELQQVILMAAAVTSALVCFDSALNRRNSSFTPWLLICFAVLAKVIPSVRHGLAAPDTLLFERWDHLGTVLSALFLMLALVAVAISLVPTSTVDRARTIAVVTLGAVATGAAGATLSYAYDSGFGSETVARLYETLGWAFAGGMIVAGVLAIGRSARPSPALIGVTIFAAVTATLTAWSSAGRSIDVGWWAVSWAIVALAALAFQGARLAGPARSSTRVLQIVAGAGAVLAVIAAVASFVVDSTWSLGWIVLLLSAIGFGALAFTQSSTPETVRQHASDQAFVGAIEAQRSAPLGDLLALPEDDSQIKVAAAAVPTAPERPMDHVPDQGISSPESATDFVPSAGATQASTPGSAPAIAVPTEATVEPAPAPAAAPAASAPVATAPAAAASVSSAPVAAATPAQQAAAAAPAGRRIIAADLTDSLAPRHYDPPTMLLSNAGLQEAVLRAFAQPTRAENETALLFVALRNSDEIEAEHGRVVIDDVARQLANRLRTGLPDAVCARFAPAAFAALLVGQQPPNDQVIERTTRTLLQMLADIDSDGVAVRVDVVGGLAQCHANEPADSLVSRANEGLERAVAAPEPSLVAMP